MFSVRDIAQQAKEDEQQQQASRPAGQQRAQQLSCGQKLGNSSRFVRVILAQGPC